MNNATLAQTVVSPTHISLVRLAQMRDQLDVALQNLAGTVAENHRGMERCLAMHSDIFDWLNQHATAPQAPGWQYNEFHRNELLSMGLLNFGPSDRLPVHDHPGSTGLLFVLNGSMAVRQFEIEDKQNRCVDIRMSDEHIVNAGEFHIFTPDHGNVHTLIAQSESVQVLDIVLDPYREEARTWFMPVNTENNDGTAYSAVKLRRKPSTVCFTK